MSSKDLVFPQEIVYVGRQPILDRHQQVYGYELLYRSELGGPGLDFDGNYATAQTVLNSFIEFGMQKLVGPHRVFINLTRTFIVNMEPLPLDKQRIVLEILEDIEFDADVIAGVRVMHENGYVVALDDYRFEPRWEPVLPYCSIVKVDITGLELSNYSTQIKALKALGLLLLAEKVETQGEYKQLMDLGFDLFQGYFFSKPEILKTPRLQSNQTLLLNMIALINDPATDIDELADLVTKDAKLSFKILRFLNSAAIGLPEKITSIKQAVVYIGMKRLRVWANLFVMARMNTKVPEVLGTSLVRAEFCQLVAKEVKDSDPDSFYTIGLFSMLDGLLDMPMCDLVKELPLPAEMIEALDSRTGVYSYGLNCAIALEQGLWDEVGIPMLSMEKLNSIYCDAITIADEISKLIRD